jgi:hypothetical protein
MALPPSDAAVAVVTAAFVVVFAPTRPLGWFFKPSPLSPRSSEVLTVVWWSVTGHNFKCVLNMLCVVHPVCREPGHVTGGVCYIESLKIPPVPRKEIYDRMLEGSIPALELKRNGQGRRG